MRKIWRMVDRVRAREDGAAMVIAVLLSSVVATLSVLMLTVGLHSDKATARGRHHTQSLSVAESGIEEAISLIEASGTSMASTTLSGSTELGDYDVTITKQARDRFTIEAVGGVRQGRVLGASRKIKVELAPPSSFDKALFSYTTVETKNNDIIEGDIWANHNVILALGTTVTGGVAAATGYVSTSNNVQVNEDVVSGGFNDALNEAIHLGGGTQVDGNITAAVVAPQCTGADNSNYKIVLDTGSVVGGNAVTWGTINGAGVVTGTSNATTCRAAPPTRTMPDFTFNAANYTSVQFFGTASTPSATAVDDFQTYVSAQGSRISGVFFVNQTAPLTQGKRIDLTNVVITGDTTIITNTPIFTNGTSDDTTDAIFSLISTYQPPSGTSCDVNQDNSECAIHLKNNFQTSGATAVLVYAPNGPVAVKNNAEQFGAIYGDSIQIKNNQTMTYDARVDRVVGFGAVTLEVTSWQEVPV